jgi:hypothetical protein
MAGTGVALGAGVVVGSGVSIVVGLAVGSGDAVGSSGGVGVTVDVGDGDPVGVGVGSSGDGEGESTGASGAADETLPCAVADAAMPDADPAALSDKRMTAVVAARARIVRPRRIACVRVHTINHSCWHGWRREAIDRELRTGRHAYGDQKRDQKP